MNDEKNAALNTDRELWREREGDYYSDSIHVTVGGGIGINCGGYVIVMPLREWHKLANVTHPPAPEPPPVEPPTQCKFCEKQDREFAHLKSANTGAWQYRNQHGHWVNCPVLKLEAGSRPSAPAPTMEEIMSNHVPPTLLQRTEKMYSEFDDVLSRAEDVTSGHTLTYKRIPWGYWTMLRAHLVNLREDLLAHLGETSLGTSASAPAPSGEPHEHEFTPPSNDDEQQCDTDCRMNWHKCKTCGKTRTQLGYDPLTLRVVSSPVDLKDAARKIMLKYGVELGQKVPAVFAKSEKIAVLELLVKFAAHVQKGKP